MGKVNISISESAAQFVLSVLNQVSVNVTDQNAVHSVQAAQEVKNELELALSNPER